MHSCQQQVPTAYIILADIATQAVVENEEGEIEEAEELTQLSLNNDGRYMYS